jgi:hypothetical protein
MLVPIHKQAFFNIHTWRGRPRNHTSPSLHTLQDHGGGKFAVRGRIRTVFGRTHPSAPLADALYLSSADLGMG